MAEKELETVEEIQDLAGAYRRSRVLLSAVELGLFTALGDHAARSSEIAQRLGADARGTDRLMNALCSLGLLRKKDGLFENTPAGLRFLVEESDEHLAGLAHTARSYHSWGELNQAVRAGGRRGGKRPFEDESHAEDFIRAMHWRAEKQAPALAEMIDLSGVKRMLDLGGGSGAFSIAFARAKADLEAVVLDLPNIVPITRRYVAEAGLSDRIGTQAGDYRRDELGRGYDLVLFSAIIHINSPEQNLELLRRAAGSLNPGGRLVISDFFLDEDRTSPQGAALFAINMLVNTEAGDTYTVGEVERWLTLSGCGEISYQSTGPANGLMIGRLTADAPI
jgi:predicted O-methyltransferase YrrM